MSCALDYMEPMTSVPMIGLFRATGLGLYPWTTASQVYLAAYSLEKANFWLECHGVDVSQVEVREIPWPETAMEVTRS